MVSVRAQSGQGWVLLLGDGSKVDKSLGSLIRRRRKGRGLFSLVQRWETRFQRAAVGGPGRAPWPNRDPRVMASPRRSYHLDAHDFGRGCSISEMGVPCSVQSDYKHSASGTRSWFFRMNHGLGPKANVDRATAVWGHSPSGLRLICDVPSCGGWICGQNARCPASVSVWDINYADSRHTHRRLPFCGGLSEASVVSPSPPR